MCLGSKGGQEHPRLPEQDRGTHHSPPVNADESTCRLLRLLEERHSHCSKVHQSRYGLWQMQEAEWICLLSLKNRRDFTAVFQQLMGGYRGDRARFFSDVHGRRARGSRHKLQKEKFQQSIRKRKKITMSVDKCWNKLPRETVTSPALQITKS